MSGAAHSSGPELNSPPTGGWRRLRGLIRKEFLQVIRDPSSIGIAFILPVVLLLLFGYGVSLDAKHVRLGVVLESPSVSAERLAARFRGSAYFDPIVMYRMTEAIEALDHRRVDAILRIRETFGKDLGAGQRGSVQLIVDAVDANTARIVEGYVEGVRERWLLSEAHAADRAFVPPVTVQQRVWFNSAVRSRDFLVPGIVALVLTLIGALLTALVMAREYERGTMEALLATPVRTREILLGKIVPYFVLGMGGMLLCVVVGVWLFQVPLRGSLWVLFGCGAIFLLAALGMGLLISALARNQFIAAQAAIIGTFLPAFILSGFIFDIDSMPQWVQWITRAVPARYFVSILQTEFLAGDVWSIVVPNVLWLAGIAVLLLGLTRFRTGKRLG